MLNTITNYERKPYIGNGMIQRNSGMIEREFGMIESDSGMI